MELGPNQTKFVEALECEQYSQGQGVLNRDGKFCCLGVGCEVFEIKKDEMDTPDGVTVLYGEYEHSSYAPYELVDILSLRNNSAFIVGEHESLVRLNDSGKYTFKDIAKIIRDNPENVFKESK